MRSRTLSLAILALAGLLAASDVGAQQRPAPTAEEVDARGREALAYSNAIQAYVFAFPLVITERERVRRERLTGTAPNEPAAPINQLGHMRRLATARGDLPYSPNNDTVYTGIGLDVSREPMILRMPEITDRYASVHVADAYVENQPYVYSTRVNGGHATDIAFVGPDWRGTLPAGLTEERVDTNTVSITVRIAVKDDADLANVRRYQDAMSITALSDWHGGPSATPPPAPPPRARTAYEGDFAWFRRAADLLAENPPPPKHAAMREIMRRIGIVPGQPFDPARLDPATRAGVLRAERDGPAVIELIRRNRGIPMATGWNANRAGALTFDYPSRAGVALVGLVGNDAEEAIYFSSYFDANHAALAGGRRYRMHFPADKIPTTGPLGFWSITMYDGVRFQFIDNPVNRYAIGSRDALRRNRDGSIDIYIQPTAPGGARNANWLPSPASGEFKMTLRIYMPTPDLVAAYATAQVYVPPVEPAP